MSKSRIPALTKGLTKSGNKKPEKQPFTSSNLFHYGFPPDQKLSGKGIKEKTKKVNEKSRAEKTAVKKRSPKEDHLLDKTKKMEEEGPVNNCVEEVKSALNRSTTPAHLNLSQTQLNALSYSLSELADKISPTKKEFTDEWGPETTTENCGDERFNSVARSKKSADIENKHSKTPYSRKQEAKHHLSKQKSFNNKTLREEPKLDSNNEDLSSAVANKAVTLNCCESETAKSISISPVPQESVESGYNSSWSASSVSWNEDLKDGNRINGDTDTDIEQDLPLSSESLKDENKDNLEKQNKRETLHSQISDVEKRINSLILSQQLSRSENGSNESTVQDNSDKNKKNTKMDSTNEVCKPNTGKTNSDSAIEANSKVNDESDNNKSEVDKQNNASHIPNASNNSSDDMKKEPFQALKAKKASLDESSISSKPKRPGLVRRRTTLVTFRQPRKTSAFSEVDNSDVLEIDEAGFVQCLTDVRAMKTMLLKLKRELQEAEVQSPLGRSVQSRSTINLANVSEVTDSPDEGNRRHTYDSSEKIHEKLRRIRTQSLSRRKHSSCVESPLEDQSATTADDVTSVPSEGTEMNENDEMKKMKEELDELKGKVIELKQERDTIFLDKEEIEHELEAKNHTIKMLQKQLEAQENSEQVTYLQRQVTTLTQQVRQQQQKISELKYRSTSPGSVKKETVKTDIKNRLRDAFARHLEESSKSHLLLSKHIEKAEFTISEAQKGLMSLCTTSTSSHTSSRESLTASDDDDTRKTVRTRSAMNSFHDDEDVRRHSWTANSVEKILHTWKETAQSIENLSTRKSPKLNKTSKLRQPSKSSNSSPHMSFL